MCARVWALSDTFPQSLKHDGTASEQIQPYRHWSLSVLQVRKSQYLGEMEGQAKTKKKELKRNSHGQQRIERSQRKFTA